MLSCHSKIASSNPILRASEKEQNVSSEQQIAALLTWSCLEQNGQKAARTKWQHGRCWTPLVTHLLKIGDLVGRS